jgi:heme exporter protein D
MAFDSLAAFIQMEGHGPYVWTCYGAFFLLLGGLMVGSLRKRRAVIQSCQRLYDSLDDRSAEHPAAGCRYRQFRPGSNLRTREVVTCIRSERSA